MHLRTKASFRCQSNVTVRSFWLTESLWRSFFLISDADISSQILLWISSKVSRLYFCSSLYRIAWFVFFSFDSQYVQPNFWSTYIVRLDNLNNLSIVMMTVNLLTRNYTLLLFIRFLKVTNLQYFRLLIVCPSCSIPRWLKCVLPYPLVPLGVSLSWNSTDDIKLFKVNL